MFVFELMVFMFCFFLGFMTLFFYLLKRLESLYRLLSDEHAQLRVLLRALESRMDSMRLQDTAKTAGNSGNGETAAEIDATAYDPLLHLTFEQPPNLDNPKTGGMDINFNPDAPEGKPAN